jgi:manganese/iron transport system substrate-binding protein
MESDSMRNSIQGDLRNMIRNMIRVGISCGAIALASCNAPSASNPATPTSSDLAASPAIANASDRLQVVATTSVLCDLTRQIAAEALAAQSLDLTCLMQPGEDPHIYRTTPADRRAIETADLVLYGGYNFDVGPISVLQATTGDAPKIAVYEVAVPQPLLGSPHSHSHGEDHADTDHDHAGADHDHADEAAGHNEPAPDHADAAQSGAEVPDPHVWHDARNGAAIAQVIGDALTQVDPEQGDRYRQATEAIVTQLQAIHNWIGQQTTTIPTPARQLVTTHDAFRYFATAYDLTVRGTLSGLSTAERPTATELAKLVDRLKADQVPAIFAESTDSNQWIQTLAQDANVAIAPDPLFVEGPGDTNSIAPTYQTMLVANTCAIVAGLGGKCDPATAPSAIDP